MPLSRFVFGVCMTGLVLGPCWVAAFGQDAAHKNLLPNPSFEVAGDSDLPVGWQFHDTGAGAKAVLDDTVARSGRCSIKLTNPHGSQPHVYGTLFSSARVKPNTTYTFSLYALSDAPGEAWFGGGLQWERRQAIGPTAGRWQRFVLTFRTGSDETVFQARINVDSQTAGLWIDDVQLEEEDQATDFVAPVILQAGESRLTTRPAIPGDNLLRNGSFEELEGEWPASWRWDRRNTQATMTVDETRAHSGRRSVKLANPTAFGPHVYGQLLYAQPVTVKPNTQYTISAYVLVDSPGIAWVGGAKDWRIRAAFPMLPTGDRWVCVKRTWITDPDETEIRIMVITESPTGGIWVDDVKLEEGPDATPFVLEGDTAPRLQAFVESVGPGVAEMPWMQDRYPPDKYLFASYSLRIAGHVLNADGARLHARLLFGGREAAQEVAGLPGGGCAFFEFVRDVSDLAGVRATVELWLEGAPAETRFAQTFELVTPAAVEQRLARLEPALAQLEGKVATLSHTGGSAYPLVALTTARDFVEYIGADARNYQLARAWAQLISVEELVDAALRREEFPVAPKYVTSPIGISGPSFVADMRFPDGRQARQPVIFIGMGPFGQARSDVEKFPGYGFNIMQVEFGPVDVVASETEYKDGAIKEFRSLCQRAEKAGVAVNLLISPHYFPAWALERWPHLRGCGGGFLQYCPHAPESRGILERFLRYTIPRIRDLRALHSICLSNEPILSNVQDCPIARANWHDWLKRRHGTLDKLNQAWGTQYASFDEIPVPPPVFVPAPIVYDFVRYNQEEHAAWHKFMADIIHELAPEVP
ncbi:MAG: carbohydrate binding domain-containing protein, partial [Armatimonadetes bacterium]|nr:carbohydrate binding domain-containing protein [Armatimonadota bacterium]